MVHPARKKMVRMMEVKRRRRAVQRAAEQVVRVGIDAVEEKRWPSGLGNKGKVWEVGIRARKGGWGLRRAGKGGIFADVYGVSESYEYYIFVVETCESKVQWGCFFMEGLVYRWYTIVVWERNVGTLFCRVVWCLGRANKEVTS